MTGETESADPVEAYAAPPHALRPPQRSNRLFTVGLLAVSALLVYYTLTSNTDDPLHLYLGLLILVGATLPVLLWAKRGNYDFPVFEVFMLTGMTGYAIPLLSGHEQLHVFDDSTITAAATGVLLFQVFANFTYIVTTARPKRTPAWTEEVIARNVTKYLEYGMIFTTAYTAVVLLTTWIPGDLQGVLRAVCYGIGIMSCFILSRMWGQGTLPPQKKVVFAVLVILQVVFNLTSLFLVGGISILVLSFLGYVTGSGRLPLVPIVLSFAVFGLLHTGKSVMRLKYWEHHAPAPTLTEIPAFFAEWIDASIEVKQENVPEASHSLLERTSLMHIMCLVVTNTPSPLPYLEGATYAQIPPQFVPRFFWKDKPEGHISTHTLAVYYGLQDVESTEKTTVAFGLLSEAYANYGYFGLALLGVAFAFALKKVSGWSALSPILSYPGLLKIVLIAWSFQSELTLSAWLGSLYQACMAVLGVPFIVRNLFGR